MEGLVPNCGVEVTSSDRRGREAKVPPNKGSGRVSSLREASFQVHAPKLFNSLPLKIRNLSKIGIDDFKFKLDKYLEMLPDEPKIGEYCPVSTTKIVGNPPILIIDHARTINLRRHGH